jgi:hypothetical protein
MNHRRLVGIDLGIATAHTVRVLDGEGATVARRRALPAVESLAAVEAAALAGCPDGTRLEVVIEPTGPAWLPIAVFFSARGHTVFRVSSQKAADLRRFLSRHAKSNGIDADTLARLPLFDPAGLAPLVLPGAERAALDRPGPRRRSRGLSRCSQPRRCRCRCPRSYVGAIVSPPVPRTPKSALARPCRTRAAANWWPQLAGPVGRPHPPMVVWCTAGSPAGELTARLAPSCRSRRRL